MEIRTASPLAVSTRAPNAARLLAGHLVDQHDEQDDHQYTDRPHPHPDRRRFRPTSEGRRALADSVARANWATDHIPSPFATWMVLSWQARPRDFALQVSRRRKHLLGKIEFEQVALRAIIEETSPTPRCCDDRSTCHSPAGSGSGMAGRSSESSPAGLTQRGDAPSSFRPRPRSVLWWTISVHRSQRRVLRQVGRRPEP
jgi:hypothetical protein